MNPGLEISAWRARIPDHCCTAGYIISENQVRLMQGTMQIGGGKYRNHNAQAGT